MAGRPPRRRPQGLRRAHGAPRSRPRGGRRRAARAARPLGIGQEHRRCGSSRGSRRRRPGRSRSAAATSPASRRRRGTSPWSSRTTRSSRTSTSPEHRLRPRRAADAAGASWPSGSPRPRELVGCEALPRPQALHGSRAASASASRSRGPSLGEPDVFLLDEPLSNLDAQLRARDARRAEGAAPARGRDDALRHARPGRGADPRRPRRRAAGGRAAAGRGSRRALPPAGQPLRRLVRRQPGDELPASAERRRRSTSGREDVEVGVRPEEVQLGRRSGRRPRWRWSSRPATRRSSTWSWRADGWSRASRADCRPEVGARSASRSADDCTSSTPRRASDGDPRRRAARARAHARAVSARARRARARPGARSRSGSRCTSTT